MIYLLIVASSFTRGYEFRITLGKQPQNKIRHKKILGLSQSQECENPWHEIMAGLRLVANVIFNRHRLLVVFVA